MQGDKLAKQRHFKLKPKALNVGFQALTSVKLLTNFHCPCVCTTFTHDWQQTWWTTSPKLLHVVAKSLLQQLVEHTANCTTNASTRRTVAKKKDAWNTSFFVTANKRISHQRVRKSLNVSFWMPSLVSKSQNSCHWCKRKLRWIQALGGKSWSTLSRKVFKHFSETSQKPSDEFLWKKTLFPATFCFPMEKVHPVSLRKKVKNLGPMTTFQSGVSQHSRSEWRHLGSCRTCQHV